MLMWQTKSTFKFTTALVTVKAAITEKKFSDRGNRSDHMETSLQFEIAPNLSV